MIREITNNETKEIRNPSLENYRRIQPEKEVSTQEVDQYWKDEFQNVADTYVSETDAKEFYDDNGKLYRVGDCLQPDTQYEVNGYRYNTDAKGRIVSAEGSLRMRDSDYGRDMEDVKRMESQDYRQGDERGHLIGHQFGGSDRLENLVPMEVNVNKGDFYKVEKTLADAVKDNADVKLKVEPVYTEDSARPSDFRVTYSVDGDHQTVVFRNGGED